jgi:hypothetical protein
MNMHNVEFVYMFYSLFEKKDINNMTFYKFTGFLFKKSCDSFIHLTIGTGGTGRSTWLRIVTIRALCI